MARARGRWTTDPGWHRLTSVGLLAGVAWFVAGVGIAGGRLIVMGAVPDAWSTPMVGAPLALGWVVQVLIASWTHLLPAIGPGGPVGHAARRVVLGRVATVRLLALNVGTALVAVGWPIGQGPVAALVPASPWRVPRCWRAQAWRWSRCDGGARGRRARPSPVRRRSVAGPTPSAGFDSSAAVVAGPASSASVARARCRAATPGPRRRCRGRRSGRRARTAAAQHARAGAGCRPRAASITSSRLTSVAALARR